jgi:glucose-1-phosphate cytidylyltransferase
VRAFQEKPMGDGAWVNGGFFVLEPGVLDRLGGDDIPFESAPLESLAADGELRAYRHRGFWQPMDALRDVRTLETLWASGEAPWAVWNRKP